MHKLLKILLWTIGVIVLLLVLLVIFGPDLYMRMVKPDHEFGLNPLPDAPDYTLRSSWAAWPDGASPAERLADGMAPTPQAERLADAFFLHPTSYGGKGSWVQPIDDEDARRSTDLGSVARQASAFNECCRVYAPRFRQSNIMGYQEERYDEIFDIGYQDIRAAFRHFLAEIDPESPIVLGSHSQGTFQMARLVAEEIDGTPLMDRLVAVYAIGHQLSGALITDVYQDVEICSTPTQTGCLISWDAHEADKAPSGMADKDGQKNWNGTDYSGFDTGVNICVNPITWQTDSRPNDKADHLGALELWQKSAGADASLGELVVGKVSAYCEQGERSNWLFVNGDRGDQLKTQGIWGYFGRNLHGSDYSLFWANIRDNATERVQVFVEER
ncbi:MAG: DUF3089 domain-containing protein [Pseudomonadota bacterium]